MPRAPVRRITRFTVMATLQAARARQLGLAQDSAYSWGLNRAIFYAAAKRGFGGSRSAPPDGRTGLAPEPEKNLYSLGNDEAYRDPSSSTLRFTIGGETQTPEAFQRQVAARFGDEANFDRAWKEAMSIMEGFDERTLRSGRDFYGVVYKPRRDALVAKWSKEFLGISVETPVRRPGSSRP